MKAEDCIAARSVDGRLIVGRIKAERTADDGLPATMGRVLVLYGGGCVAAKGAVCIERWVYDEVKNDDPDEIESKARGHIDALRDEMRSWERLLSL